MNKTPSKNLIYPHTGLPCHLTIDDTFRPTTILVSATCISTNNRRSVSTSRLDKLYYSLYFDLLIIQSYLIHSILSLCPLYPSQSNFGCSAALFTCRIVKHWLRCSFSILRITCLYNAQPTLHFSSKIMLHKFSSRRSTVFYIITWL